jgi:thiol:disulfide interchange protein/DsbC/DsbD-like thiol-disulfide interchange protein
MRYIVILFTILLSLQANLNIFATTIKAPHVKTALSYFKKNKNTYLVVSFKNDPKWHTYWKNPGDAGLPMKIKFSQNGKSLNLKELEWVTPKRYIEQGNMWAYGYDNLYSIFFQVDDLKPLKNNFDFYAQWLVCKNICIPGKIEHKAKFDGNGFSYTNQHSFKLNKDQLNALFETIPLEQKKPVDLEIYLNKDPKASPGLVLNYSYKNISPKDVLKNKNLLIPFKIEPFGFKHEKIYYDKKNKTIYGRMLVEWDGDIMEPEVLYPEDGQFIKNYNFKFLLSMANKKTVVINKIFNQFSITGQKELDKFYQSLTLDTGSEKNDESSANQNILLILLYAFIGGLILNLMPCVLPVISLKLFGLISHQNESHKNILKHNLSYSFGILSTFTVLASLIVFIKTTGEEIGWGFQLQSPIFVSIMIIAIFILALNLFGFFEFRTPFGNKIGGAELKKGFVGDFLSGVLTTILSTPCSAPFLGTALTFAFTTSTFNIYLTFIFIGLGLAAPFILTGFVPKLVSFLPKPGNWMNQLKLFLGATLALTAIWLTDVLMNIVDPTKVAVYFNILLILILVTFTILKLTKKIPLALGFSIVPIGLFLFMLSSNLLVTDTRVVKYESMLDWSHWSAESVISQPGPIFIDFTAKWCLTCKVNKRLVFETDSFSEFSKKHKLKLMIADWTKRDPKITAFLKKYNVVSVPAYFLKTKAGEIKFLGETISLDKIETNL